MAKSGLNRVYLSRTARTSPNYVDKTQVYYRKLDLLAAVTRQKRSVT